MRFIKNGPEVPDRLVQAHEEDRVVFFCGAGISYPAGLPGFKGLIGKVFEALGETPSDTEDTAINEQRFDLAFSLLERRINKREVIREKVREILTPQDLSDSDSKATHQALLTLAKSQNQQIRLVTTNFDRIFQAVEPMLPFYKAPLLPVPKKTRWNGLVHLHGLLPTDNNASALNNLVLSSGDFGLAYLTERWASRFVTELFRTYTVCFVGYSVNDAVLRYMLDALLADRLLGEDYLEVFAFSSSDPGKEFETRQDWDSKGITPILYVPNDSHALLHRTLHNWAAVYRDGLNGKVAIISREAVSPPRLIQGDGHVDQVLWAITDPSGQPAKTFAELDPPPPVEWLDIFAEVRYSQSDLPRFGINSSSSGTTNKKFSLLCRPTPYALGPRMAMINNPNVSQSHSDFDAVMHHIARWLVRHLDKSDVLRWVITNGCSPHPTLSLFITKELETAHLPRPLVIIWNLICGGLATNQIQYPNILLHNFVEKLKTLGWNSALRTEFRKLIQPIVQLSQPYSWDSRRDVEEETHEDSIPERRINEFIHWEVGLVIGEYYSHYLDQVRQLESWPQIAIEILPDFTTALHDTFNLMGELEGATEWNDISYLHRPSIIDHPQNNDFHPWTLLIDLCRDAWLSATTLNPTLARVEFDRWNLIRFPVFRRLVFFAMANSNLIPPKESLNLLLADEGRWIWSIETQRESYRLLAWLAPQLDEAMRTQLCSVILTGPPRSMFRDELEDERWEELDSRMIWERLEKLKAFGAVLSQEAEEKRSQISSAHPEWQLQADDRDEFPTWSESGDGVALRTQISLPRDRVRLATALTDRPGEDFWYQDDWRELCQTMPGRAITTLILLSSQGNWPIGVWRESLQVLSEENLVLHTWRRLSPYLLKMPSEILHELRHAFSWWLKVVGKVVPHKYNETWFKLCDRILDILKDEEPSAIDDPVGRAINHPIGHVTEAMILWWYRTEPQSGQGLPALLKHRLTRLADLTIPSFRHGRVLMAAHLYSLYLNDPSWAAEKLLPHFDWNVNVDEAKGLWEGYLWTPRINDDLLDSIKPSFLATTQHYDDLGKHGKQFASLLISVVLELPDYFSSHELRNTFKQFPPKGLADAAGMLARSISNTGERRDQYWENRVKPVIKEIWPKSADCRSGIESLALADVCVQSGSHFPEAVEMLLSFNLLRRTTSFDLPIRKLKESDLSGHYPLEALKLLDAIIDTSEQWPPSELGICLEQISGADSSLLSDVKYRRLKEYIDLHGRN